MLRTFQSQIGIKIEKDIKEKYTVEIFTQDYTNIDNINQKVIDKLKNNYLIPLGDSLYSPNCNITIHIEEEVDSLFLDVNIFKNMLELLGFYGHTLTKNSLNHLIEATNNNCEFRISFSSDNETITIVNIGTIVKNNDYSYKVTLKTLNNS